MKKFIKLFGSFVVDKFEYEKNKGNHSFLKYAKENMAHSLAHAIIKYGETPKKETTEDVVDAYGPQKVEIKSTVCIICEDEYNRLKKIETLYNKYRMDRLGEIKLGDF